MTDVADPDDLPRARSLRSRWPGLVWAIPLSALILVTVLGVHAFLNRGIKVVISFDIVAGVKVGDTKVMYQGYEVGHVTDLDVEHDTRRIDVTVVLDGRAGPVLRTGTIFWLNGVNADLSDLSSVKNVVSGPSIGMAPSYQGEPTHKFRGLTREPAVLPGTPGTFYQLTTDRLGSVKLRSPIRYHGQEVGKVTGTAFDGPDRFRIGVFMNRPYDRLVGPSTFFYPAAAVELSLGAGSVQARSIDPSAILSGGISMDRFTRAPLVQSPPNTRFALFDSRADAETGASGPGVAYKMMFAGGGGELAKGAPVTLMGFKIGEVTGRSLELNGLDGMPATNVTVDLDAARMGAALAGRSSVPADPRAAVDAQVNRLLAQGYRAAMSQQPPIVGRSGISLVRSESRRPLRLIPGAPPEIPTVRGAADPGQQVQEILGKINRVPIEEIGRNIADASARLRSLISSPKIDQSLTHLRDALARVDEITAEAEPQIQPTLAKLREAATQASAAAAAARGLIAGDAANPDASLPRAVQQLGDAAASIRALADYLNRHPEALIKGKQPAKTKVRKAK